MFRDYVHLPSKIIEYHYTGVILYNVEEVYIFYHGLCISGLEHAKTCVPIYGINTFYNQELRFSDFMVCSTRLNNI